MAATDEQNLEDWLEDLAGQMRRGDYTESSGAVLVMADAETGILTYCGWRADEGLLRRAVRATEGITQ